MLRILNSPPAMEKYDKRILRYFLCLPLVPRETKQITINAIAMGMKIIPESLRPSLFKGLPQVWWLMQIVHGKAVWFMVNGHNKLTFVNNPMPVTTKIVQI